MKIRGAYGSLALAVIMIVGVVWSNSTEAAEPCRMVRGRMELANGAPSVRIWIVGTNRILGVHQRDATFDELPANIRQAWKRKGEPWGYRLYGDFKVCPLTPDRQGWMQMVRVESGKHLRLDVD